MELAFLGSIEPKDLDFSSLDSLSDSVVNLYRLRYVVEIFSRSFLEAKSSDSSSYILSSDSLLEITRGLGKLVLIKKYY